MKINSLFVLLGIFFTYNTFATTITLPIRGNVDGDTIKTTLNLPCPLCFASVRIRDIDTPERGKKAKCEKEALLAIKASNFTASLIGLNSTMQAQNIKWDKFGGRINAIVIINGYNIGQELISNNLGRPYIVGKKSDWCN